ncbi:hypothetical protein ACFL96_07590 [Thermoproteota archaeon]
MVDITGKQDAITIKDEYQKALDYAHEGVKMQVKHLYGINHKLKDNLAALHKHEKDLVADEEERISLYRELNNMLVNETNFEKDMMKLSQKGKKNTQVTIKPRIKDSDIDTLRINAMQEYLHRYPKYASKSSFKNILEKISEIEKGIKNTKKKYNYAASEVMRELSYWPRNIMQGEDRVKRFKSQLKEGQEKLKNMRYLKSIMYRFASETEKMRVNIHTLYYRIEENENIIQKFKEEGNQAKKEMKRRGFQVLDPEN